MKKITVDLPEELLENLDKMARSAERSRAQQIRHILYNLVPIDVKKSHMEVMDNDEV